jgi:hypothetical protein
MTQEARTSLINSCRRFPTFLGCSGNPRVVTGRLAAASPFFRNLRVSLARSIIIQRFGTKGLLAKFLYVLEVIARARANALFRVDWVITGTEKGFKYGDVEDHVWDTCSPYTTSSNPS